MSNMPPIPGSGSATRKDRARCGGGEAAGRQGFVLCEVVRGGLTQGGIRSETKRGQVWTLDEEGCKQGTLQTLSQAAQERPSHHGAHRSLRAIVKTWAFTRK